MEEKTSYSIFFKNCLKKKIHVLDENLQQKQYLKCITFCRNEFYGVNKKKTHHAHTVYNLKIHYLSVPIRHKLNDSKAIAQ